MGSFLKEMGVKEVPAENEKGSVLGGSVGVGGLGGNKDFEDSDFVVVVSDGTEGNGFGG